MRLPAAALPLLLFLAPLAAAQTPERDPAVVADDAVRAEFLRAVNALAEKDATARAAELLATRPEKAPEVALAAPGERGLAGPELCRRLREGTAIVGGRYKCGKCAHWHVNAASGFFISEDGVVVTNRHVLATENLDAVAVMDGAGKVHAVKELLAQDEAHDLVLLRAEGKGFRALALAEGAAEAGAEVAVLSHPGGRFWTYTQGVVSRLAEWHDAHVKDAPRYAVICITAEFAPGSSGAPVADRRGNVLGVATRIQPIVQAKDGGADRDAGNGDYTAMVIRMAIPAEHIRAMVAGGGRGR